MNFMFIFCVNFLVLDYDEVNCNIVFGVSFNVFWNVDFSYMQ